jgi:hypothetical protein
MTGLEFVALLAQLVTITRAGAEVLRGRSRGDVDKAVEEGVDASPASVEVQRAVARVSPRLRDAYGRRLKKAYDRYVDVVDDPASRPFDWNEARDRATYEICAVLEVVKDHNGGVLPDDLEDMWNEFSCDRGSP